MSNSTSVWRKDVVGWTLYDFANTIYYMNIVSLYLKRYIIEDLGKDDRYFDIPFSISMLVAAVLLPALGAMSDHSTKKKIYLFLFTVTCCAAVGLMAVVPPSAILVIMLLFIVANFAYEAGQPFYNSLLYSVAEGNRARFVSGIGVALGYVGSIAGMLIVLPFVTGSVFSIDIPFLEGGGKEASFLPTGILFMLFALPLFWWVREAEIIKPGKVSFRQSYREVWDGVTATKKYPGVLRFLIADYFFEDSATTVIINIGLFCSVVIGFGEADITRFLIISTVSAVIGSFIIGKIAELWSLKKILNLIIIGWVVSLFIFVFAGSEVVIWIFGSVVGILLGGLWTTSRPLLAELVPRAELGRFFGLFSLSGRAAAIIGPLLWTSIVYLFNADRLFGRTIIDILDIPADDYAKLPYRIAVLSLSLMMVVGLYIFRKVPDTHGRTDA
ncbi:MAG: MFS transporter [Candidatus Zixiibacteriota bacterium]|nr:MAG: MFS transporter [candidate division Zixibacteria bacterium]